jgi:hypothetical protein
MRAKKYFYLSKKTGTNVGITGKRQPISRLDERMLASQERFCCVVLVVQLKITAATATKVITTIIKCLRVTGP